MLCHHYPSLSNTTYMTSIEIRLLEENGVSKYHCYCGDCWQEIPMVQDPADSSHSCEGVRDITVFKFDLLAYEDTGTDVHPIDYMEAQGYEVMAFMGDQADYCCYVAVRGNSPMFSMPSFISYANEKANELKLK